MIPFFLPLSRSLAQLHDRVFLGVVARGVFWAAVCFAALHVIAIWAVHQLLGLDGWIAWAVDLVASVGASLLTLWLFVPVGAAISTLYIDRIAAAVERLHYPTLPPARGAPVLDQVMDGIVLGLRLLGLLILALVLALLIPGLGLLLGWAIAGYGIGRGLFMAVAMRRLPRPQAEQLYRQNRTIVLFQGIILAAAAWIPLVNLMLPVIGAAAMVHVLDMIMTRKCWVPHET
jgi:uncharacterized protein involved in cysteine biosynthesis